MKFLKYISISALLLICVDSYACWHPKYTPGEYYVFYSYEKHNDEGEYEPETTRLNTKEWQQYTSNKANYEDVKDVVYNYSTSSLKNILEEKSDSLNENTFIRYLIDTGDYEVIKFLILAKECEYYRMRRTDPWWYPTKEDLMYVDLRSVLNEALAYKGKKLRIRYLLQAIRAAYTMGEHELCLQLWNDEVKDSPESIVKVMCEDYIGGIYFQKGEYEEAITHYAKTLQASSSFWWCADKLGKKKSDIDRIKILYKYCPTAPELAVMVQKICREAEIRANLKRFDGYDPDEDKNEIDYWYNKGGYKSYSENRNRYLELRDFALTAASENKSSEKAMWQYAAAFLTLLDGDSKLASRYLAKAERMEGTTFIKNNIRILHIMTDAMHGKYDKSFDGAMLPRLRWLDGLIVNNLTDEIKQEYNKSEEGRIFCNYSMYYYNDMMRKIVLAIMVPRYTKKGEETKALLLGGMVTERLRTLTGYRQRPDEYRWNKGWNIDFSTDIFCMMDTLKTESVVRYKNIVITGGKGSFEKFFASHCYKSEDYLNEIIGTKYMREEQFDKAIDYLSKVTVDYDTTLNIYEYFKFDPFYESYFGGKYKKPRSGYKLDFATKMYDLKNIIKLARNDEIRTEATYKYALGLMSATKNCWALFCYKKGADYNFKPDNFEVWGKALQEKSVGLMNEIIEHTINPELKAECLAAQVWLKGNDSYNYVYDNTGDWVKITNPQSVYKKNWKLLSTDYSTTDVYARLQRECDYIGSYICD